MAPSKIDASPKSAAAGLQVYEAGENFFQNWKTAGRRRARELCVAKIIPFSTRFESSRAFVARREICFRNVSRERQYFFAGASRGEFFNRQVPLCRNALAVQFATARL